jgi:hypothetical protein
MDVLFNIMNVGNKKLLLMLNKINYKNKWNDKAGS